LSIVFWTPALRQFYGAFFLLAGAIFYWNVPCWA
jgi:hypothetical protein